MSLNTKYECDTEFVRLLSRDTQVDVLRAAFELARDAYPDLQFEEIRQWVADRAADIANRTSQAWSERELLRVLTLTLATEHGLAGEAGCFDRADSSYVNRVIATGVGLPITLSLLYIAVAREVGLELQGVGAPMQFLTRLETAEGPLFLDPFGGGRIMSPVECVEWLSTLTDLPTAQIAYSLEPTQPRAMIVRMLNNLKTVHNRTQNWEQAWLVQNRLAALIPGSYRERRDLAIIALRARRPGEAIPLLESCLQTCPDNERAFLQSQLADARTDLANCN